jgi:hypothetical protein
LNVADRPQAEVPRACRTTAASAEPSYREGESGRLGRHNGAVDAQRPSSAPSDVFDFKYDGLGEATLAYNVLSGIHDWRRRRSALVDGDYEMPFPFTGKINGVTISVEKPILTEDDKKKLEAAQRASQD